MKTQEEKIKELKEILSIHNIVGDQYDYDHNIERKIIDLNATENYGAAVVETIYAEEELKKYFEYCLCAVDLKRRLLAFVDSNRNTSFGSTAKKEGISIDSLFENGNSVSIQYKIGKEIHTCKYETQPKAVYALEKVD